MKSNPSFSTNWIIANELESLLHSCHGPWDKQLQFFPDPIDTISSFLLPAPDDPWVRVLLLLHPPPLRHCCGQVQGRIEAGTEGCLNSRDIIQGFISSGIGCSWADSTCHAMKTYCFDPSTIQTTHFYSFIKLKWLIVIDLNFCLTSDSLARRLLH